jgi:hypothetical protein
MPESAGSSFMVIVADDEDETSGGIAFFGTAAEAAAHVEALLENGSEREKVSVFAIKALATEVRYRPVVTIASDGKTADDKESVNA